MCILNILEFLNPFKLKIYSRVSVLLHIKAKFSLGILQVLILLSLN